PGRVVVQAQSSDHYAIQYAIRHDADAFYRQEMEFRREAGYPPFSFLACLGFSGTAEKPVEEHAGTVVRLLVQLKQEKGLRVEILGPAPAPLYRLRGRFRRQILLKSPTRTDLRSLIVAWQHNRKPASTIREYVDIDPVDMM
ncbi:MAG: primosomal protein N', partial [Oryzomonas sp.]